MTDSPAVRAPLDPQEQPILDQLLSIRTQLELLRADKSTYVKSEDVIRLYGSIIEQVERVNKLRTHKRLEQNRGLSAAPLLRSVLLGACPPDDRKPLFSRAAHRSS